MPATDHRAAALADLSRAFAEAFGETLPAVHRFGWSPAKTRSGGVKAVGTGEHQGRTLYGAKARAALAKKAGGGKAGPGFEVAKGALPKDPGVKSAPAPGEPPGDFRVAGGLPGLKRAASPAEPPAAAPAGPTSRRTRGGVGVTLHPYQKPRPLAPGDLVPAGVGGAAPPPTPAEAAKLDGHQQADTQKYGSRAARIIRRVTEAVRGLFTLGGLVTGAGLGAKVGGLVAGPLGVAVGTAVGGGIGGLLGRWGGSRVGQRAGEAAAQPRVQVAARRLARAVAPKLAAAPKLATAAVVGPTRAGAAAKRAANATRRAMATSAAGKRQARRDNKNAVLSESGVALFAEPLPPDVVAVVKARLAELAAAGGYALPADLPDEVILEALDLAARDEDAQAMAEARRAVGRAGESIEKLARC